MDYSRGRADRVCGDADRRQKGALLMLPFHLRLAELYRLHKQGKLTHDDGPELLHCLAANERYCRDAVKLQQLEQLATLAQDADWLNELRIRRDALQLTGRAPT